MRGNSSGGKGGGGASSRTPWPWFVPTPPPAAASLTYKNWVAMGGEAKPPAATDLVGALNLVASKETLLPPFMHAAVQALPAGVFTFEVGFFSSFGARYSACGLVVEDVTGGALTSLTKVSGLGHEQLETWTDYSTQTLASPLNEGDSSMGGPVILRAQAVHVINTYQVVFSESHDGVTFIARGGVVYLDTHAFVAGVELQTGSAGGVGDGDVSMTIFHWKVSVLP